MTPVNKYTSLCIKSELNVYALAPTQTCIQQSSVIQILAWAVVTDNEPIDFVIPPSSKDFVDSANTWLYIAKTTTTQGDALLNSELVGQVNLFMHSLFSHVNITFNEKLTT